jgi:transposase
MLTVETIGRIRREHLLKGKTIKEIARDLKVSRNTVRRILRSGATSFEYEREVQPRPKLGRWTAELVELLTSNAAKAAREQLTLIRVFEELRGRGYDGGYDAVRRYARRWAKERGQSTAAAYVPLSFAPGEAYQFDWSHEVVLLSGVTVIVKAAHVRLCHSRMMFVRVYPRETQEMVFDAHDRAFALFKGACGRGIYDNMKTAVETIFVGKQRLYNRRFLQMCSHYLVDPVACTPASGWEKGQVENQVGLIRERFFTPRLRFKNLDELNAWLLDKCIAYAKMHHHPELTEQTIWEVFEAERPKLVPYAGKFDGFHSVQASVSKTCLVRFDNNKYSVMASAVGIRSRFMPMRIASQSARTGGSSLSILVHSAVATRFMTPGITCRCSPVSPVPCATAHPSRTGCCQPRWSVCGASSPAPTTAIGRWSISSPRYSPTGCRRSKRHAPKRLLRVSTPPTSSSTSWPASVIPARRPRSSRRPR